MIFRRLGPVPQGTRRKLSPSFLVSVGVHLVVAVALMRMLILNGDFVTGKKREAVPVERIGFVRLPRAGPPVPTRGPDPLSSIGFATTFGIGGRVVGMLVGATT